MSLSVHAVAPIPVISFQSPEVGDPIEQITYLATTTSRNAQTPPWSTRRRFVTIHGHTLILSLSLSLSRLYLESVMPATRRVRQVPTYLSRH